MHRKLVKSPWLSTQGSIDRCLLSKRWQGDCSMIRSKMDLTNALDRRTNVSSSMKWLPWYWNGSGMQRRVWYTPPPRLRTTIAGHLQCWKHQRSKLKYQWSIDTKADLSKTFRRDIAQEQWHGAQTDRYGIIWIHPYSSTRVKTISAM